MISRGVILSAVIVYLAILLGCVFTAPTGSAAGPNGARPAGGRLAASRVAGLPFRGAAIQLQRIDWMETEYCKSIDELVDAGFDTVMFVVSGQMQNGSSSRIYIDARATPNQAQLGALIAYAKDKNLRVVLMPIVLLDRPRGMEWRGTIKPEDWNDWWNSYREFLHFFSMAAEIHRADVFVVGSELVSTEAYADQWRRTIEDVRRTFRGMLTYSSNWDHYKDIPFWDQLDLIGMNSYYKLGEDENVSAAEIERRWRRIQENLLAFQRKVGRPLVLLEAGWCSLANSAYEPWDYTRSEIPLDLDLQKRLYEGFFRAWHGVDGFGGFMVWEWSVGDGGPKDRGYTPEKKPAEAVLREWLAKPRWAVN